MEFCSNSKKRGQKVNLSAQLLKCCRLWDDETGVWLVSLHLLSELAEVTLLSSGKPECCSLLLAAFWSIGFPSAGCKRVWTCELLLFKFEFDKMYILLYYIICFTNTSYNIVTSGFISVLIYWMKKECDIYAHKMADIKYMW